MSLRENKCNAFLNEEFCYFGYNKDGSGEAKCVPY